VSSLFLSFGWSREEIICSQASFYNGKATGELFLVIPLPSIYLLVYAFCLFTLVYTCFHSAAFRDSPTLKIFKTIITLYYVEYIYYLSIYMPQYSS
jgi:hypothetical protein